MGRILQCVRLFGIISAAVLVAAGLGCGGRVSGHSGGAGTSSSARGAGKFVMQKYVTDSAAFVLYAPKGWKITDACDGASWMLVATDSDGACAATMVTGAGFAGGDVEPLAKFFAMMLGQQHPDLVIAKAWKAPGGGRMVFEGTYTARGSGKKEFRSWVAGQGNEFLYQSIEAPVGRLSGERERLLTVLASVRPTTISTRPKPTAATAKKNVRMVERRLSDGSATFLLPEDWTFVSLGKGHFVANDPSCRYSFACKETVLISPDNPYPAPAGIFTLPYMEPCKVFQALRALQRIATNMQFVSVTERPEAERSWMQTYTAGPVKVQDFVFTCIDAQGRPYKGYTHGTSLGSYQGKVWTFWDTTVAAPADEFDAFAANFAAMFQSYRIDKTWVNNALAQSAANLASSQAALQRSVTDYADSTRTMIRQAYDERQKSNDYLSYQRSQVMRGESDWVSQMEGGAVYHTDSWGTRNTYTGETYEGAPFDSVHFEGKNPKYDETMQPVNTRELWERNINR